MTAVAQRPAGAATDPAAEFARLTASGASVLVRPVEAFEGLGEVVARVAGLSRRPLLVTDLVGPAQRVEATPGPGAVDEPLLAFHTSGSTGRPKCVVYRREVVDAHARVIADALDLQADSGAYVALPPPRFAYGISVLHSHAVAGVPVATLPAEWQLPGLADALGDAGTLYLLPQHTPLLLGADLPAGALGRVVVAGGRLSGRAAATLAERFPGLRLTNMYGQAELGPRLSLWDGPAARFVEGTIGRPLPGVELTVAAPPGEVGDVVARTPYAASWLVAPPYTFAAPGPGDAPVRTGDRGIALPGGQIRHEGRGDHVLNVAGTKVDAQAMRALLERELDPVVVRITSRPARVGGDVVPVVEIVPGTHTPRQGAVRRALHAGFGPIAGLCDIKIVDRLTLGESGK